MLEIKKLTKVYKDLKVLNKFSVTIKDNEFVGIIGPNGVGKTTLIKCITGICKIQSGDILIDGKSIFKYPYETKQKVGVCFQGEIFDRFFNIYDMLKFNAMYNGLSKYEAIERVEKVLKLVKLEDKAKCYGNELSGGMKKRFQIAQAIVHNPEIIILDEPSAGVDLKLKEDLYKLLLDLHLEEKKTILLISHYLNEISNLCDRAIFIKEGELFKDINKREYDFSKECYLDDLYRKVYMEKEI